MLYLGHFSFSQRLRRRRRRSAEPWHGHFTAVADAPDPNAALSKFRRLLGRLGRHAMFEGVREIYLDVGVEIRSVPAAGFIAHFSMREGDDPGGVSTSVRGAKPSQAMGFSLEPNDSAEEQQVEPFVVLGTRPRLVPGKGRSRTVGDTRPSTSAADV